MAAPGIEINNAQLEYDQHLLFNKLSLKIPAGNWTCLLGPSGVGKSSLLRLIAGLKTEVTANPIQSSDGKPLNGRIAYMAQNESLFPWLSIMDNILIGYRLRGQKITAREVATAKKLLQQVGLEKHTEQYPRTLSGGMRQRVLLVRTVFEDKPIILMDEPFASLDVITRAAIQELAAELLKGRTVLLVTHDPLEALRLGHHIYVMSGRPATITSQIELAEQPPRDMRNTEVLKLHGQILSSLSHTKEVLEC